MSDDSRKTSGAEAEEEPKSLAGSNEALSKNPDKKEFTPEEIEKLRKGVKWAGRIANALDKKFLDPIIGAIFPAVGDIVTALPNLYYMYVGHKMGMSFWELGNMLRRGLMDLGIGAIPLAGDAVDVFYRSHLANAKDLKERFDEIEKEASKQFDAEQPLVKADIKARTKDTHSKITKKGWWPWSKNKA
jgi:hypothetical protein